MDHHARRPRDRPADDRPTRATRIYTLTLPSVTEPLTYRLEIGDSQTRVFTVGVREKPTIEEVEVTLHFPAYLGRADETVTQKQADLEAPQYTVAELRIRPSAPIAEGHIESDSRRYPGRVEDAGRTLVIAKLPMVDNGTFTVHLENDAGHVDPDPRVNRIRVVPDRPPTVELLKPDRQATAAPGDALARDDPRRGRPRPGPRPAGNEDQDRRRGRHGRRCRPRPSESRSGPARSRRRPASGPIAAKMPENKVVLEHKLPLGPRSGEAGADGARSGGGVGPARRRHERVGTRSEAAGDRRRLARGPHHRPSRTRPPRPSRSWTTSGPPSTRSSPPRSRPKSARRRSRKPPSRSGRRRSPTPSAAARSTSRKPRSPWSSRSARPTTPSAARSGACFTS